MVTKKRKRHGDEGLKAHGDKTVSRMTTEHYIYGPSSKHMHKLILFIRGGRRLLKDIPMRAKR